MRLKFDPKQRDVVMLKDIVTISNEISLPLRFDEHQICSLGSIVLHIETTARHGHYISHSFDSRCGRWYCFNDATVTPLNITASLTTPFVMQNAFLLFYVKQ
ncbi:hypothetical protein HPB50_019440 [Hyalomma asiaticum]|uniref:Uncharacterized protein n=1 Tax=Hyalomma asiaticum TaxID=266040 RepID=A0ACB7RPG1_HYAAI|nr:hypothetical protein HPB50_019440 [Hyalomma asiaticum]